MKTRSANISVCAVKQECLTYIFEGDETMKTILRSQDLSCPSCVAKIENALQGVAGVTAAKVHFNTGRIEIEHDPAAAPAAKLVQTVREVGYESQVAPF
jgi:copper chaperone